MISKIALGKKPLSFIDYEVVIETTKATKAIIAINLVCKGTVLTKIKTYHTINNALKTDLGDIVEILIKDFISHGTSTTQGTSNANSKPPKTRSNKCEHLAKEKAADTLFQNYNL